MGSWEPGGNSRVEPRVLRDLSRDHPVHLADKHASKLPKNLSKGRAGPPSFRLLLFFGGGINRRPATQTGVVVSVARVGRPHGLGLFTSVLADSQ